MTVNLWMSIAKKTKTPQKTQKNNNLINTKYQNVKLQGAQFLHSASCPHVSYATALVSSRPLQNVDAVL